MSYIQSVLHHLVIALVSLLLISFLFLLSCSFAFATEFVRPRPLVEYEDIMLAQELDAALGLLNEQLAACLDAGKAAPDECNCQLQKEAQAARLSFDKVMQSRPKWKGKILFWKNTTTLQSRNLVMPAIERQLSSATACSLVSSHK